MYCKDFNGYTLLLTTGAAQDFALAVLVVNGYTLRTCDMMAGHRDVEGQLGRMGNEECVA